MNKSIFFLLVVTFASANANAKCKVFDVFYIPLEVEFYAPPSSIEDSAFKKFKLESCNLEKVFGDIASTKTSGKDDPRGYRIKVIDSRNKQNIYIDQQKNISSNSKTLILPASDVEIILKEIVAKADSVKGKDLSSSEKHHFFKAK